MKSSKFEAKKPYNFDRNQNKFTLFNKEQAEQPNTTGKKTSENRYGFWANNHARWTGLYSNTFLDLMFFVEMKVYFNNHNFYTVCK